MGGLRAQMKGTSTPHHTSTTTEFCTSAGKRSTSAPIAAPSENPASPASNSRTIKTQKLRMV